MSYLLELLGKGLEHEIGDVLDRYFWAPQTKSLAELEEIVREHPDWPDMQLQAGLIYLRALQMDEAVEHLSLSCKHKPDYLPARLALAAAYCEQARIDKALEHLKLANQTHPGKVPVLFAIGFCLEKLKRPDDAIEYYRDAVNGDPTFRAARERLASIAVLRGDNAVAIEQYQYLRDAYPQESWIRSALAHLYYRDRQYTQSVEEYETAIAMEPENWSLQDDEVEALVAQGQLREAIEKLHALIEQQGPFADLQVRLGDLYSKVGDDAAAQTHYREAIDISPTYLEAHVKLGTQHLISGRWEEAAEIFHRATELNDKVLTTYVGLGVAQMLSGNRAAALNSFDLASAIEPNSSLLMAEMARLQLKSALADSFTRSFETGNDTPLAEIDLDNDDLLNKQIHRHAEAVEASPNHADLRYRYGVLLRAEGRLGEALEQFSKAVELNPSYVQAILKLGVTQQELGLVEQAIETFTRAVDLKPEYVDLHYRLGLLYTDRRQFEAAAKEMELAAAGAPSNENIRSGLALALQNLGLMDKAGAAWRSMWKIHEAKNRK